MKATEFLRAALVSEALVAAVAASAAGPTISLRRERFSFDVPSNCVDESIRAHGFTAKMTLELPADLRMSRTLLTVGGACEVYLRHVGENGLAKFDDLQHYAAEPLPDGSVPVIEGVVHMTSARHPDWKDARVGFPASRLSAGRHEVVFACDGVGLRVYADGVLADENFVFGSLCWTGCVARVCDPVVRSAMVCAPAIRPTVSVSYETVCGGIQYYRPSCGAWIGDVVPFAHDGTVHVFYLLDRRHHASKWGQGAHYWGHLSTTNLTDWIEHPPFGEFESQYESCGTGTPFFHRGRFYYAYGLHTERFVPDDENARCIFLDEAVKTGRTTMRTFEELAPRFPGGMTYAESEDGVMFRKSRKIVHFSTNPSVYALADGTLRMYADGIWQAEDVDGPWRRLSSSFPPYGRAAAMRNSLECPSYFEWNGWHYMLVGLLGCYSSGTPDFANCRDLSAEGCDCYGGETVPMVIQFGNNRRLMASWVFPFGSYLVFRELVQLDNHELGTKWCPETLPEVRSVRPLTSEPMVDGSVPAYALYETTVDGSAGGRVGVRFCTAGGTGDFELTIDTDAGTAQFAPVAPGAGFPEVLPTARELLAKEGRKVDHFRRLPRAVQDLLPYSANNYRLEHLRGLKGTFPLRIIVRYDRAMPVTIVDAEIAGKRTMITTRKKTRVESLSVHVSGAAKFSPFVRKTFSLSKGRR